MADGPRAEREGGTGTLGKAMRALEIVAREGRPMRFTDILARSDQPRGTLHRQLGNLVAEGLLDQPDGQSYTLGLRLLELAARAWAQNDFRRIAEPHLRALHEATGETVHLGILRGAEVVYLDKVESRQAVRMHSQIGNASPAYCTGVGKAALSVLGEAALAAALERTEFRRHTPATLADRAALLAEIAAIRAAGIAFDREEHEPGIHCVAAPIGAPGGSFAAGLSVTAPAFRVPRAALEGWAPLVRAAAAAVTADMTRKLGPRT